jgi:hypothetical protein
MHIKVLVIGTRIIGAILLLLGLVAILSSRLDADNTELALEIGVAALLIWVILIFLTRARPGRL